MNKRHITSAISQTFGKFAHKEFPHWFQNIINYSYVKLMGVDMSEFHDPSTYKSLNALFTRKIRELYCCVKNRRVKNFIWFLSVH